MNDPLAVVDAWNDADWPAYRALTADDYRYEDPGAARGIDDVLAEWRRVRRAFPDVRAEVVDVLVSGDAALVGLVWHATEGGPSAKRLRVGDAVTLRWSGRRLAAERHRVGILAVLGAVPAVTRAD